MSAPLPILAVVILALGSGLAAAHWLAESRFEKFYGYVRPRTTTISAPRTGVISQIAVRTGDPVNPGTPVARLDDEGLETRYQAKHGELASLNAELQRARAQAELELDTQLRQIDMDIFSIQRLAADYQQEKYDFELRKSMLEDSLSTNQMAMFGGSDQFFSSLMLEDNSPQDQMVSVLRLKLAENGAEVSSAQVEWCEWNRKRLEKLRQRLPDVIRRSAGVDVLAAQVTQSQDELSHLEGVREALEIKSSAVGRAGILRVTAGSPVVQGAPIVDVLDDIERMIIVNVPSAEIHQFEKGGEVRLTFAGREQRAGRIVEIAPQAKIPTGSMGQESYVEVRIEPCREVWPDVPADSRVIVRVAPSSWSF